MTRRIKRYYQLLMFGTASFFSHRAIAQTNPINKLDEVGRAAGYGPANTDITRMVGSLVQILLGFVGLVFLILIIWGGLQWMTSGGNEQKIEEAKKRMLNATIGLVLVLMAFSIARFVTKSLQTAFSNSTPAGNTGG